MRLIQPASATETTTHPGKARNCLKPSTAVHLSERITIRFALQISVMFRSAHNTEECAALSSLPDLTIQMLPLSNSIDGSATVTNTESLQWYSQWLDKQLKSVPSSITERLRSPFTILLEIANCPKTTNSLDEIATRLLSLNLIKPQITEDGRQVARLFAFAALGWQTMLYQPAFGTCPPSQLAIVDVLDGYTGQAFMKFTQDQSRIKKALPDFLLGFGLMLPRGNLCISEDLEDCQAFEKVGIVNPNELNAALLQSLARIKIKWVDVMAPHLEFDKATGTLFLFRYPSFCVANIPAQGGCGSKGVLHDCAAQKHDSSQWASEIEVTQLLHEILLSYRLFFGQAKESRRLFQSMHVFEGHSAETHDPLLPRLCSDRKSALLIEEREFYRLSRDFPILRSRIAILQYQMSNLKPRGWRELWNDKRDSAQWLTFWAVIIIGGSGIFLTLIQVILQSIQLAG